MTACDCSEHLKHASTERAEECHICGEQRCGLCISIHILGHFN